MDDEETPPEQRPEKDYSNRFMQQKLKHFFPQFTPQTVVLALMLTAIIFIPIGAAIIIASDSVFEKEVPYSHINNCPFSPDGVPVSTFTAGTATSTQGCTTRVEFTLDRSLAPPVYLYYRLKGFHQNYRLYSKSMSEPQMAGGTDSGWDYDDFESACAPVTGPRYKNSESTAVSVDGVATTYGDMVYRPCGVVAWSMFNDSIALYSVPTGTTVPATGALPSTASLVCDGGAFAADGTPTAAGLGLCEKRGIAFGMDRDSRYVASSSSSRWWTGVPHSNTTDPYLQNGWYAGEPGHKVPRLDDEDFMVWSRIAGLKDFRKPYRKINVNLGNGTYFFDIAEYWPTVDIDTEKIMIIATTSWVGGKNYVLGGIYVTVGCIAFIQAVGFLAFYVLKSKDN